MKSCFRFVSGLLAALLAVAAPCVRAASHNLPGSEKLTVNFPNWQHYSDIRDRYDPSDKGELSILDQLKRSLEFDAKYAVPDGEHLTMTFSDIHLAGDFEPWRGPNWDDVRIVKEIYPPRFKFTWQLTDASGRVLKQGTENLVDMNFQMRLDVNTDDPLHYEKDILHDWMDQHVHP